MSDEDTSGLSRRIFLTSILAGGATACHDAATSKVKAPHEVSGVTPPAPGSAQPAALTPKAALLDYTKAAGIEEVDEVVKSACQFCNSLCGVNVSKKAGRIVHIYGEERDPVQAGHLCMKGPLMAELAYNRHRILHPMKRVGGRKGSKDSRFEKITWEQALQEIAVKLLQIRDSTGPQGVANKTSGRLVRGVGSIVARFFELYGSPNATDVGPVCNDAGGNALAWTFGLGNFTNGYGVDASTGQEDLGSAKLLLFLGTNQAETHPVTFEYLLRSRSQTGAKLVVVDPRLTPTAAFADQYISIRPHTDMALAYGMLAHIIESKLYNAEFVNKWVVGFDELKAHIRNKGFSPEWAAQITTVPASVIRDVAEQYARAAPAAIFCNAGISHQLNAFHTYRALAFLAAITGNIGRSGGGCNFMHNTWPGDLHLPPLKGSAPKRSVQLPVGPDHLATAILERRPYALRALFAEGNLLVDAANTSKVKRAFEQLELFVYPGLFMEEPAWYADYILPVPSVLEQDCIYMRRDDRGIRFCNQVIPPRGEARPDIHIWIDLAEKMGKLDKRNPAGYWTDNLRAEWKDFRKLWDDVFVPNTPGMGGMSTKRIAARVEPLRWPCPSESHAGVSTLYLDHPSWYEAAAALGHPQKRFLTPSGRIEVFTADMDAKLARAGHSALPPFYSHPEAQGRLPTLQYEAEFVDNPMNPGSLTPKVKLGVPAYSDVGQTYPLTGIIGRPSVAHFATITHWTMSAELRNGVRLVQIGPRAAQSAGIKDGDPIWVESPRGRITGTASVFSGIREDSIFIPNLFGPAQVVAEELGLPLYEAANTLVDQQFFDNLSGQQAYKCFACRVRKAE